jgi:glycine/D-amino acid oxidase-like deaminating enzyme
VQLRGDAPPWGSAPPGDHARRSHAGAVPASLWLDGPGAPPPREPLVGRAEADLAIVGGGLTGLWAAVQAKEEDPTREVAMLEARTIGGGATGHSGGFIVSSLTHGVGNGLARFPDELPALERLGRENFEQTVIDLWRHGIDCDLVLGGELTVALQAHELEWLAAEADQLRALGHDADALDGDAVRAEVHSPTYLGGLWQRSGAGTLHPAKLAWGLARTALDLGVRVYEGSPVDALRAREGRVELSTPVGRLDADQALLATGAFRSPARAVRRRIVPVWDYVLATEPLSASRRAAVGWQNRQGVSDAANRFHYYRLTADHRIVWGGYDAVYHFRNGVGPHLAQREVTFDKLAAHFFTTFPQLEDVRFTHRWGAPIDTCSRFSAFFGTLHEGLVAYVAGHTGLGIGASRFGARVALDLLAGRATEATALEFVRSRPVAFPPEPLRWGVIQLTRNRLAAADRRRGKRGLWLRLLDRLGLGFDS